MLKDILSDSSHNVVDGALKLTGERRLRVVQSKVKMLFHSKKRLNGGKGCSDLHLKESLAVRESE